MFVVSYKVECYFIWNDLYLAIDNYFLALFIIEILYLGTICTKI